MKRSLLTLFHVFFIVFLSYSQDVDTSITKADTSTIEKGEYPYIFPIMGRKAHAKGYKLPKPHGIMLNTFFNRQGIILSDFQMDFTKIGGTPNFDRLQDLSDLVVFGPSEGEISTVNLRLDTWILPFLSIGGYYGKVQGKQTITLTSPINLRSSTDIDGEYYGLSFLVAAPLGMFDLNLAADYSASWTTNVRLDAPVRVDNAGIRIIKRFLNKSNPEKHFSIWAGAQFQKLAGETSGKIDLTEALDLDGNEVEDLDNKWNEYLESPEYDNLTLAEKVAAEAQYQIVRGVVEAAGETTVHYKFNKDLEFDYNMLLGAQYQFNEAWQIRTEYGFLQSKKQLLFSVNYRFGL